MKQITLHCAAIQNRENFHEALANEMHFPEWYGNNLDAMYDCLTELSDEVKLILRGWKALQSQLGDYAVKLIYVLHRASEDNPNFHVELENE